MTAQDHLKSIQETTQFKVDHLRVLTAALNAAEFPEYKEDFKVKILKIKKEIECLTRLEEVAVKRINE